MKKRVLFVGSFRANTKDNSTGGQAFACQSLLNSQLSEIYDFILIDSTSDTVPAPPVYKRVWKASRRFIMFFICLVTRSIDTVLIFSSARLSFVEKGIMVVLAGRLTQKRVIFSPRSGLSLIDYEQLGLMRWFMPKVIRSADYTICQGSSWRRFYMSISGIDPDRLPVVPNWIDWTQYSTSRPRTKSIKKARIKILYLGWLEEYKGILDFLEALKLLLDNSGMIQCDIYGGGSLTDEVKNVIARSNFKKDVEVHGWADKTTKFHALKTSDIYVLPSHFEGFPNALLEAMASELCVVASSVGAVSDVIKDRINGLLFERGNVDQLAKKLQLAVSDSQLRMRCARAALQTVKTDYSVERAIVTFKNIL